MIELEGIVKVYADGLPALRGISLRLDGGMFGLQPEEPREQSAGGVVPGEKAGLDVVLDDADGHATFELVFKIIIKAWMQRLGRVPAQQDVQQIASRFF